MGNYSFKSFIALALGLALGFGQRAAAEESGGFHGSASGAAARSAAVPKKSALPSCFEGNPVIEVPFYGWGAFSWTKYTLKAELDPEEGTLIVSSDHEINVKYTLDKNNHSLQCKAYVSYPSVISGEVSPREFLSAATGLAERINVAKLRLRQNDPEYKKKKAKIDCIVASVAEEANYVRRNFLNYRVVGNQDNAN